VSTPDPWVTSIDGLGAHLARFEWLESRLFEIAGAWVPTTLDPRLRRHFDALSQRHGWHATLLRDRRPFGAITPPPACPLDEPLTVMGLLTEPGDRVAALSVTRSALVGAYRTFWRWLSADLDGTTVRLLDLVLADLAADAASEAVISGGLAAGTISAFEAQWDAAWRASFSDGGVRR
jgi:hypothetical protein